MVTQDFSEDHRGLPAGAHTYRQNNPFLTYYGLGIMHKLRRHYDIISTVRGGQD
jgi:hypothetical protein